MTLGQFAVVVGASPRWVQNALSVLGLPRRYTPEAARVLGLARELREQTGMPLGRAYPLAKKALARWPGEEIVRLTDDASPVGLVVDLKLYLSVWAARLSLSRTRYAERARGRPRKRRKGGIEGAREYGVDISLLEESLRLTPAERLKRLDENVAFVKSLRVAEP